MPTIRPSVDLQNSYNEISKMCKDQNEPMFIRPIGMGIWLL